MARTMILQNDRKSIKRWAGDRRLSDKEREKIQQERMEMVKKHFSKKRGF